MALRKLLGQTAIYGVSSVVARVLNYFLVPLYTRLLAPELYGIVSEFYVYIAMVSVVLSHGMETAYFRYAPKTKSAFATAWASVGFVGLIFLLGASFGSESIAHLLHRDGYQHLVLLSAFILALDAWVVIPLARLRERKKPGKFALVRLTGIGVNLVLNLWFFLIQGWVEIEAIFWANAISSFVVLALLVDMKSYRLWRFSFKLWRRMMRFAWPIALAGLAYVANEGIDRAFLRFLLPPEEGDYMVGIYSACYKLSIIMSLCVQAFRMGIEPYFFQGDAEKEKTLRRLMHLFSWFGGLVFFGVMSQLFWLKGFIGENYHEGLAVVPILLLANGMLGVYFNLSYWYKTKNKTIYGALFSLLGAVITLGGNYFFIPKFGYMASAWSTLGCYFLMVLVSYLCGRKQGLVNYNVFRIGLYWLFPVGVFVLAGSWLANPVPSVFVSLFFIAFWLYLGYRFELKPMKLTRHES